MKDRKFKTNRELVWHFLRGSKAYFIIAIVCISLMNLLALIVPRVISYTVDTLITGKESNLPAFIVGAIESIGGPAYIKEHLYLVAVFLMIIGALSALCSYLYRYYNNKGAETLVETMRNEIFAHIARLPFSWHTKNQTGDIIQRCTSDVDAVKNFVSGQLTEVFRVVLMVAFSLYFMFTINVKLALIAVILIPINIAYSAYGHKRMGKIFEEADVEEGKLSAVVQENLTGVRVVRAFGRELFEKERFEKQNHDYWKMWIRMDWVLAWFWSIGTLLLNLQIMTVVVLGAVYAVRGEMLAGEYIAFFSYNIMLAWPIRLLGRLISGLSRSEIATDRIRYIMDSEPEKDEGKKLKPDMTGDIVFNNVSFAYDESKEIVKDVSFRIKGGTTVGILGGTGSGKSTLAEKLAKYYSIPKLHMDTLQFQPGWQDSDRDWMLKEMKDFLSTNENWVIDGNYSWCCYEERMEQADQIIFLNFSSWTCLLRAFKRYLKYRGKVRESMAKGCPEQFNWEFIRWILWDGRTKNAKDRYQYLNNTYPEKMRILHSQAEIDCFLRSLKK